ncbi:hypothetical protein SPD48_13715 [Pseudogracilibacillus sp. SE30717A]|uniref:hypothetical protein n=1 Tax=Pseudogracilibacillus sp. SE30717A TaxID=3098293 RepID=UPI00300DC5AB
MIVQLKGNIRFPITLDPTVWIFDDRKVILEEAFIERKDQPEEDKLAKAAELFDQEIYFQKKIKPPVNNSINRFDKEKTLTNSFVMPIADFIKTAEINNDASRAILKTKEDDVVISTDQLESAYFLFALEGKPLKEDGPVHLFFGDGSNKETPIKGIYEIIID